MPGIGIGIGIGIGVNGDGDGFTNALSTSFDGVDEFGNIDAVQTALASNTQGTISGWIKPIDATPASVDRLISFGDTNGNAFINMYLTTDGKLGAALGRLGTKWDIATNAQAFTDNTWSYFALVQDAVSIEIYLQGVVPARTLITSFNPDFWFNDVPLLDNGRIANLAFNSGSSGFCNCKFDEIRFWNVAKNATQILADFNGGQPTTPDPVGLVSTFRMGDNDIFPTITDSISSNNGTLVNMEAGDFQADVAP